MTEKQARAIEMTQSGKYSMEEIRDAVGYSSCMCVRQALRNCGIKQFPPTENKLKKAKRNRKIRALRMTGMSFNEIADVVGVNKPVIASVCSSFGLKGRVSAAGLGKGEKRVCPVCGSTFECGRGHNKKYCSHKCQKSVHDAKAGVKRRAELVVIDRDISLKKLYERDGGICHICGELTDWDDFRLVNGKKCSLRNYPSIDHIVPVSLGGEHSWKNVALAHIKCNSAKCNKVLA